ncbi:MAG: substrate-binding domain-containing protein [Halobacteriaceae archaeon]
MPEDGSDILNVRVGKGVSRRDIMKQLGAVAGAGAAMGLAGCSSAQQDGGSGDGGDGGSSGGDGNGGTTTTTSGGDGGDGGSGGQNGNGGGQVPPYQLVQLTPPPTELDFTKEPPERSVQMYTHDASTSFFDPCIGGMHDAARQLGWTGQFSGPTSGFSVEKQVSLMESGLSNNPDVMITTVADASAYDKVIQRALDNDVTVVLYNTNAYTRKTMREKFGRALAYTGQNQLGAGYACGLAFVDKVKSNIDDPGKVTIGTCCPGHSALSKREQGIKMAVQNETDWTITETINYTGNSNEGVSKLQNHITANPDLDGIAGTDAFTWFIGSAIKKQDKVGDIVGGGFDLTSDTLQFISDGVLQWTTGQDPYSQGYIPTVQAFEYLDRGMPPKDYLTGAEIIESSNIDFAQSRSGGWGDLLKWQGNA